MRKAVIFNFLLEATIIASIAILLMLLVRKLFRKQLGSRVIAFAWLLVAIRLLCPLSLPNPAINEIRSPYASDAAIRPIAGQVKVRFGDLVDDMLTDQFRRHGYEARHTNPVFKAVQAVDAAVYNGDLADVLMWVYLAGAAGVAAWFVFRNIRFRHMLKVGRVEAISGKVELEYHQLCVKRKVRPLPVWYTDPLPSACLVGVVKPYIALPLTSKPNETIRVLDHEICHYKGWDHLWGVLRLLCCILHWFNPLVWLAASLSMTDCELACDERVAQGLDDEQRKEYAGILVLAAARRNAPGLPVLATGMTMTGRKLRERVRSIIQNKKAVRWLACGFAVLACVLLVFAFATSEYFPTVRFSIGDMNTPPAVSVKALETGDQAIDYAKQLWQSSFLQLPDDGLEWAYQKKTGGYIVQARSGAYDIASEMVLLPDGTLASLYNEKDAYHGTYQVFEGSVANGSAEELAEYLLQFLNYALPGHSDRVEAFREGQVYEADGVLYADMYGLTLTPLGVEKGYSFMVRLSGDAPQVVSFQMEQPVHARLWQQGMTDFSSPEAHRINGLLARAYTEADRVGAIGQPGDDVLTVEEALQAAMDVICDKYGETPESLRRFEVLYLLNEEGEPPRWRFDFECINTHDMYFVNINAWDGEVLYTSGRDEGNG